MQKRLQEASYFTAGWPSHPLNVNNAKMHQIIFAIVQTEDNSYPPPQQFRGKTLTRGRHTTTGDPAMIKKKKNDLLRLKQYSFSSLQHNIYTCE